MRICTGYLAPTAGTVRICGIDVAAWFDEEGWFGSFPGSRSFCGLGH